MVQKDRNIKVTGERRERIDLDRIADLIVRMARSGRDFTTLAEVEDAGETATDSDASVQGNPAGEPGGA